MLYGDATSTYNVICSRLIMLGLSRSLLLLLGALKHFYGSDFVVVCIDDQSSDGVLEFWASEVVTSELEPAAFASWESAANAASGEGDKALIYCELDQPLNLLMQAFGLKSNSVWLIPNTEEVSPDLRLDSNWVTFTAAEDDDLSNNVTLVEWYRLKGGKPMSSNLGTWSELSGLESDGGDTWERRSNLRGAALVNTVLPWEPFTILPVEEEEEIDGFMPDVGVIVILVGTRNILE